VSPLDPPQTCPRKSLDDLAKPDGERPNHHREVPCRLWRARGKSEIVGICWGGWIRTTTDYLIQSQVSEISQAVADSGANSKKRGERGHSDRRESGELPEKGNPVHRSLMKAMRNETRVHGPCAGSSYRVDAVAELSGNDPTRNPRRARRSLSRSRPTRSLAPTRTEPKKTRAR
jgi:hypothetical protein